MAPSPNSDFESITSSTSRDSSVEQFISKTIIEIKIIVFFILIDFGCRGRTALTLLL
jgi:hypothetical protein